MNSITPVDFLIDALRPTYYKKIDAWPNLDQYYNRESHKHYRPHHAAERSALLDDEHRYILVKGGEGGGKSVFGVIRDLERFSRGCHGIIVSPDFEHFKKSLWPEFRRWCPWDMVVEKHRYRQSFEWEPSKPFSMAFKTGAIGYFGGIEKPISWEGPNVNFAHFDEARKKDDALALKVLDGRIRIPGPAGDPPQLWITTTPKKHWLYDYFGPIEKETDPLKAFKENSLVVTLLTKDNEINLETGYTEKRGMSLTEAEKRVLLEAAWESIDDIDQFLPNMFLWDRLKTEIPAPSKDIPLVMALDGAVTYDTFGISLVGRHWDPSLRKEHTAIYYTENWVPPGAGEQLRFRSLREGQMGPEDRIRWVLENYNVVQVAFDPVQLFDLSQRLGVSEEGLAWFEPFSQARDRLIADKQMLDMVIQGRIHHNGNYTLREHVENADKKVSPDDHTIRIVKRHDSMKIDLLVATSMANFRCLQLNI